MMRLTDGRGVKVKGQGYNDLSSVSREFVRYSTRKSRRSTKMGRKLVRVAVTLNTSLKAKDQIGRIEHHDTGDP